MEVEGCVHIPSPTDGAYFLELDCDRVDPRGPVALADTRFGLYLYDSATLRLVAQAASAHDDRVRSIRHAVLGTANSFLSASDDGRVRGWDPRQGLSRPVVELSDRPASASAGADADSGLFATDADGSGMLVAAGGEARVLLWDVRMSGPVLKSYDDVHTESCTAACFHAGHASRLLTGSVDGLLCLLDATREATDDELVKTVCNSGDAVVRAGAFNGWDAADDEGAYAYCVSGTEVVSVWSLQSGLSCGSWPHICALDADARSGGDNDDGGDGVVDGARNIALGTGGGAAGTRADYLVDCFTSGAAGAQVLSVLAGTRAGELHMLPLSPAGDLCPTRRAAYGAAAPGATRAGHHATVRACAWSEARRRLYTVGEDGRLCCWQLDAALATDVGDEGQARAMHAAQSALQVVEAPAFEAQQKHLSDKRADSQPALRRAHARGALLAQSSQARCRWKVSLRAAARVNWLERLRAHRSRKHWRD